MKRKGFDSAQAHKADDKLNRWDFSLDIYNILVNTPIDWSVRVGIYAGWGEGKTTVLNFIKYFAERNDQIII